VRIRLFGPLEVVDDAGAPVEIAGNRLRTLLARLALDAGRAVDRDSLLDAVWPDAAPAGAVNALQTLVTRLRRLVPAIESRASGYGLTLDPSTVDIRLFRGAGRSRGFRGRSGPVAG
jgi:DNA-binding SARP family transcriptional activator